MPREPAEEEAGMLGASAKGTPLPARTEAAIAARPLQREMGENPKWGHRDDMDKTRLASLSDAQFRFLMLVEESFQSWMMARLVGSALRKAIGDKRAAQKIRTAREAAERWIDEVREKCRVIALQTNQLAPVEYHEVVMARANFGDLPRALPDLRGRHRGAPLPNLRKVRLRYQEISTHLKAQQPRTPEGLRRIVPTLTRARAEQLVGQNYYHIAATITADEFQMKSSIILSKTKGIPMSVCNALGDWQLDTHGRCTFRPWIKGGKDLGKAVRVRGFGDLPRGFRLPELPNTGSR